VSEQRSFRYYEFVMAAFVTVLICSNLIGPAKIAQFELPVFGAFVLGAGALFFPISYVFGDILTEVYGYARARRVIWAGFAGLGFASFMAAVVVALPPAPFWKHQAAYEVAFGNTWRIVAASMVAYFCGEFVNSYVLAKMKIMTRASGCGPAPSDRPLPGRRWTPRSSIRSPSTAPASSPTRSSRW
jgi:uncharacterized integral membrane protein (TIGR00697 family)